MNLNAVPTPYAPASRRPIADLWRTTGAAATGACVRAGVSPNLISCASVVVAAGAAACFLVARDLPVLLLVAAPLCLARLWFNMLDGMVALAGGTASRRGEIFNELPDRISDVLIFAGVAHSGLAVPALGYWAAILALLTAYVGTLAQAVAGRREYGGVMSKQWRMFALALAAIVAGVVLITRASGDPIATARLVFNGTLVLVTLGCIQTTCVRLAATFRRIDSDAGPEVCRVA